MKTEQIQDVYDQHAPTYDRSSRLTERLVVDALRQEFGQQMRGTTLEIAIGSGLSLPYYSPDVTRAVGIDLSAGMLAEARKRARSLGREIELIQMDAERLAFPDNAFDTAGISLALCTVPRPEVALAEIARVCKPDGTALFLEHVRSPHWPVYAVERMISPSQERSVGCSWVRDTVGSIRQAGFQVRSDQSRLLGIFRLVVATPPPG
jgi:ubiquinone/menaquinone biosynthesis C-methylase UbiE